MDSFTAKNKKFTSFKKPFSHSNPKTLSIQPTSLPIKPKNLNPKHPTNKHSRKKNPKTKNPYKTPQHKFTKGKLS
jgi:hypothetical protein